MHHYKKIYIQSNNPGDTPWIGMSRTIIVFFIFLIFLSLFVQVYNAIAAYIKINCRMKRSILPLQAELSWLWLCKGPFTLGIFSAILAAIFMAIFTPKPFKEKQSADIVQNNLKLSQIWFYWEITKYFAHCMNSENRRKIARANWPSGMKKCACIYDCLRYIIVIWAATATSTKHYGHTVKSWCMVIILFKWDWCGLLIKHDNTYT